MGPPRGDYLRDHSELGPVSRGRRLVSDGVRLFLSPTPRGNLHGVRGIPGGAVYAVGEPTYKIERGGADAGGVWLLFETPGGSPESFALWGNAPGNLFSVGDNRAFRFDGSRWLSWDSGPSGRLYGIYGASSTRVFAVGEHVTRTGGVAWAFDGKGVLRPTIGPLDMGDDAVVTGWRISGGSGSGVSHSRISVVNPLEHSPIMSYCGSRFRWISKPTYEALHAEIKDRYGQGAGGNLRDGRGAGIPGGPLLEVSGTLEVESGRVVAFRVRPPGPIVLSPPPPAGEYALHFLDGSGSELHIVEFAPEIEQLHVREGVNAEDLPVLGYFSIDVPVDPSVREVELRRGDEVLESRTASATAPTVEVLFPNGGEVLAGDQVTIRWRSDDADGDPLTYTVLFSPDGGASWEALASRWTEEFLELEGESLRATEDGRIQVLANDGFHGAADTSDGAFTVPNHGPHVFIDTPAEGQLYTSEQLVVFRALAFDREDGLLSGERIEWSSSLDGSLGTGASLALKATELSEGEHMIQASARDLAGAEANASVSLRIGRQAPEELADVALGFEGPETILVGDMLSYSATVVNHGPLPASGVRLDLVLPPGISSLVVTSTGGECDEAQDGTVECEIGEVAVGGSVSVDVSFTIESPGAASSGKS